MAYYKRKLPHWQHCGAEYFVTFRLAGSLPKVAVKKLKATRELLDRKIVEYTAKEKRSDSLSDLHKRRNLFLKRYEDLLDDTGTGPTWLKEDK